MVEFASYVCFVITLAVGFVGCLVGLLAGAGGCGWVVLSDAVFVGCMGFTLRLLFDLLVIWICLAGWFRFWYLVLICVFLGWFGGSGGC